MSPIANSPFFSKAMGLFDVLISPRLFTLRPEYVDLSQKTAIVTGANVGIGLETARKLAEMGATVILACRNKEKGYAARADILSDKNIGPAKVEVILLDCSDLTSVEAFARDWGNRPLDIIVNNAGVSLAKYTKNPQGFEATYVTNTLAPYLLTNLLLPIMSKYARIVNVTSAAQYDVPQQLDVDDLDRSKLIGARGLKEGDVFSEDLVLQVYRETKLMQVFFTKELQARLDESNAFADKAITVHVCHPGIAKSTMLNRADGFQPSEQLRKFMEFVSIPTEQGACTSVHLAISKEAFENKGKYWANMALRCPNPLSEDKITRSKIWDKWAQESQLGERRVF